MIVGPAEWIALLGFAGTLAVTIFTAGQAFARIRQADARAEAQGEEIEALKRWKEDARVDLGSNFVRKAELSAAIEAAIRPVRETGQQTHDLVRSIAARMHIPAVEPDR